MKAEDIKEHIRASIVFVNKTSIQTREERSTRFVEVLSGRLDRIDKKLADEIFELLRTEQPKVCKDCQHSTHAKLMPLQCMAPQALTNDLVEGYQARSCKEMRLPDGPCAPSAFLFVNRVSDEANLPRQSV